MVRSGSRRFGVDSRDYESYTVNIVPSTRSIVGPIESSPRWKVIETPSSPIMARTRFSGLDD